MRDFLLEHLACFPVLLAIKSNVLLQRKPMRSQSIQSRFFHFMGLLVLMVGVSYSSSAAGNDAESNRLIQSYSSAVKSKDIALIKTAWTDLNNNKEAVEYMQKNMPHLYYAFQMRGLYFQMDNIDANHAKNVTQEDHNGPPAEEAASRAQDVNQALPEIKQFSVSEPEVNPLPPNGEIVDRSKNASRRNNRDIAIGNPNQNRQANQMLIESRTRSFYDQKFQKVPDALVPRGSVQEASQETSQQTSSP